MIVTEFSSCNQMAIAKLFTNTESAGKEDTFEFDSSSLMIAE